MIKTTVYLPEELEIRLEAESTATGISKAELIRRGIAMVLEASTRPRNADPLPTFDSGRARSSEELDQAVYEHIRDSAARR
ncbi:MAG TPA: ribbon-helix-helix domain-containing protein [Micromonosporaceae bacterium]|jgi:hypothetical protein|nr:ribbon-helix-helix domain-containing protein [Micromonosporaceae bacterium]